MVSFRSASTFRVSQRIGWGVAEFVDLERLWEDATALLTAAHRPSATSTIVQHPLRAAPLTLMTDGGPALDPDTVVYEGSSPRVIVDAKYSITGSPIAGDIYQIAAYVGRLGASAGVLAYVSPQDRSTVAVVGTLADGAKVIFWSLAADAFHAKQGALSDLLFPGIGE